MNKETIKAIAEFMGRATLQASEIEAYQRCLSALQVAYDLADIESDTARSEEAPYDES